MAKKAQKTSSIETLEPRIYEIGYLLSPAVRDEDLAGAISSLKDSLSKLGASVFMEGNPEFIDLAYEMIRVVENKKIRFNQAHFGWMKIEIDPAMIQGIKEFLDGNTSIIRYLLISTTRENTVAGKKPLGKMIKGSRRESSNDETKSDVKEPELAPEAVEAELDNEIKEMVKEN